MRLQNPHQSEGEKNSMKREKERERAQEAS
jgi:hypothetical protein